MKALLRALPRTVLLLGLISLFNDTAGELVYPLLPLYLATVLMAGPRALGLIEGVAEAVSSLVKLGAGVLADRMRRMRVWVIGGYSVAGLARPLLALTTAWPGVLLLRFADRVGKGLRSAPRDALISTSVAPDRRGLAFGFHRAMDNLGAVIGPLAAAGLLALGMPIRHIFWVAIIPAALVVALALAVPEPAQAPQLKAMRFDWRLRDQHPALRRYLVVLGLFTLGNSSNMFLLLRAHQLGVSDVQIPLLWALMSGVAALLSTHLSSLSDRLGRARVIGAGWAVYAGFYLLFGLLPARPVLLWPMFGFYGLFLAATEGAEKALVGDLAHAGQGGTAFGWYNLVVGLLLLPASVLFGWLWQHLSPLAAFGFSAGCALTAVLLLLFWVRPAQSAPG
jgi:MFS family permease